MDNKDYLDKLIDLQKVVKRIDYQISELASEKRRYILDYLSTPSFQEGDKVKTKSGDVYSRTINVMNLGFVSYSLEKLKEEVDEFRKYENKLFWKSRKIQPT